MNDIKYRQPGADEAESLLALSASPIGMTDVYTYVKLHPDIQQNSRLWLGEKNGSLTVLYDDGAYFTKNDTAKNVFCAVRSVKGTSMFSAPQKKYRLALMEYKGGVPETDGDTVTLAGKDVLAALHLISGNETLPDYLEKRYVDIARGINAGLCVYCGIYENGALVSCGGIAASNEKYALIGNIFTKESCRRRGLAAKTVKALVSAALEKGLTPILYCEKEMTGYYEKLQFVSAEM